MREPSPEELALKVDMTPEKVKEARSYDRIPISLALHIPGLTEDGESLQDVIYAEELQPIDHVSFTLLQEQLHSVLDTLSEREAGVIALRFGLTDGEPKTLDAIGKVYRLTRERIRQIESKTLSKLRHRSRSRVLYDYYDGHPPLPSSQKTSKIEETKPAPRPANIPVDFEIGDCVTVMEGPFESLSSRICEIKPESQQVIVMVTIFEQETPVTLGFGQFAKNP